MEFFVYHRDRAGSLPLRMELLEEHWSYMDGYGTEMIARGPTLADDRVVRRWRNLLGRTMWDFPGGREGGARFLVLGLGSGPGADLAVPPERDGELVAYGPLLSDDGGAWLGTAALVRAPDEDAARAFLTPDAYASIDVLPWEFGGRR